MKLQELISRDEAISKKLQIMETDHSLKPLAVLFAHSGDSWFWLVGLLIVFFAASLEWKYRALVMMVSFVILAVIVLLIKFTVRRRRPEGEWGKIYRATDPHSFPSGHAARAFLFAVLALGLGPAWFGITLIIWAPLVTLSRVITGVHYLSDVIAGSIIGVLAGCGVLLVLPRLDPLLMWTLSTLEQII